MQPTYTKQSLSTTNKQSISQNEWQNIGEDLTRLCMAVNCPEACEQYNFSSKKPSFYPTEHDWKIIRNELSAINLSITSICNSDCNICAIKKNKSSTQEMTIRDIQQVLHKIGTAKKVVLFGGEPTTRSDIFEIIKLIKNSGNIPALFTNGLRLAEKKYVQKLKQNGLEITYFSFDGFKDDIYEKLRGDRTQYYLKKKALKNLEELQIKTILSATIANGINDNEISKIWNYVVKNNHFIKGLILLGATPYGKFHIGDIKSRYLSGADILKIFKKTAHSYISEEYFLEYNKLRSNLNKLLKNIGLSFPIGKGILFSIKKDTPHDFITLKTLQKINQSLEKNKFFSLFRYILKSKNILKYGVTAFSKKKLEQNLRNKNTLSFIIGNINTPINHFPIKREVIGIRKKDGVLKGYTDFDT